MTTFSLRPRLPTFAALTLACVCACAHAGAPTARAGELRGAGATFPAPVYAAWAEAYASERHVALRYDAIGSGQAVALVSRGQVDFGASDAPLPDDALARAGLLQFPVVIGAVVPVVNIAGIARGALLLDAKVISAIYRGRIDHWRDPAIVALNPSLALPDARITVVHRADASGTTYLWSRWLAQSDPTWRAQMGSGLTLAWPVGTEGLGNEGVASLVQRTRASIGYVAFAYARQHHLSDVALPSHDGPVVRAGRATFEAAVAAARWRSTADLVQELTNEPGAASWPLVGASFALMRVPAQGADSSSDADSVEGTRRAAAFFDWAMTAGAEIANDMDYIALPADATRLVERSLREGLAPR